MDRREIEDRLEACRPDSHDLSREDLREAADALFHDENLAARFAKQQGHDRQVANAMREVAAPAGLADRILAQLASTKSPEGSQTDHDPAAPLSLADDFSTEECAPAASAEEGVVPAVSHRGGRRIKLAAFGAIATAACLLLAAGLGGLFDLHESEVSVDDFHQKALAWSAMAGSGQWDLDRQQSVELANRYPVNEMVGGPTPPSRFQVLDPGLRDTDELVAFDYSYRGRRAYLFIADTGYRMENMSSNVPPATADSITGGWNLAAWRNESLLYVFVFDGDANDYRGYLRPQGGIALLESHAELLASR